MRHTWHLSINTVAPSVHSLKGRKCDETTSRLALTGLGSVSCDAAERQIRNEPMRKIKIKQTETAVLLFVGYTGFYICRSNLAVVSPLLVDEFGSVGLDKEAIGLIASAGLLAYAIAKPFSGIICDFLGGRPMFVAGMFASVLATVFFSLGTGFVVFLLAWILNRLAQSTGWGALVKVSSHWYSFRHYGKVMGFLSLAFLVGDAIARLYLGSFINLGVDWKGVFFISAGTLAIIALLNVFFLKPDSMAADFVETTESPNSVYRTSEDIIRPSTLIELLRPLLTNRRFQYILLLSFGLTFIRETFNLWIPLFLVEADGVSIGNAAIMSLTFPLAGAVSSVLFGYFSDGPRGSRQAPLIVAGLIPVCLTLLILSLFLSQTSVLLDVVLFSLVALFLIGPYTFLAGAMSMDLAGKTGCSTAAGFVDGVGYVGAAVSSYSMGVIAQRLGWDSVFLILALLAGVTLVIAGLFYRLTRRA